MHRSSVYPFWVVTATSLCQAALGMAAARVWQNGLDEGVPLAQLVAARLDHAQRVGTVLREASVHAVVAVVGCLFDGFSSLRDRIGIKADDPSLHDVVAMNSAQITFRQVGNGLTREDGDVANELVPC